MARNPLTYAERSKSRGAVSSLTDWSTQLETAIKRMQTLPPKVRALLTQITGTEDPQPQLRALHRMREQTEQLYRARLLEWAPDSLSCFVEYMTPDEPPAPHHEFLCLEFEAIERRELLRAAFSMPPGHAKTKFLSRYGPAWYLGKNPDHRWLQGGHSQDFVEKEIGQYVRDIIDTQDYRDVFPGIELNSRSTAAGSWRLAGHRGAYVGKGVGQSISGYRGHIGGIDDPIGKGEDVQSPTFRAKQKKWLMTDFRQRLLPGSPLFIVATRWHKEDMIGFAEQLTKEKKGMPWKIINLNGIIETEEEMEADVLGRSIGEVLWPDFYGFDHVMDIKSTMDPPSDWFALWKGTPRDAEGVVVKKTWFQRYDTLPRDGDLSFITGQNSGVLSERVVRRVTLSVDCAEKATTRSKFTAVGVWIETVDHKHYLAEVRRKRCEFPEMTRLIEDCARDWINKGYNVGAILVEDAANGTPYIQQRRGLAPAPIIAIPKPSADSKVRRFDSVTPMWEGGEVLLPRRASWLPDYEDEILAFPGGTYSDQVDQTSQYLTWARVRKKYGTKRLRGAANA